MSDSNASVLSKTKGGVGIITLNRPQTLNALNMDMLCGVVETAQGFDADPDIGAIVITGSEKAFAAGADIKEMASKSAIDMFNEDWFAGWAALSQVRIPVIAAVNGYALGGGCELALMCDFVIAGEKAKFGQPEVNLGVLPGIGGSQRLTRAVGKSKAMDMCLTGRMIDADEAERAGMVSRVVAADALMDEALDAASTIAARSRVATQLVKEAVNTAFETPLQQGLLHERRLFHLAFASEDQKEGMAAFSEKRDPNFTNR
ncbi:enoyl-CoA hydratase [Corynebacterium incognita]|uniref:Probable enoyl-CoA hydratase echA8 n=1 Tax=Corynebacterium incognita TaxID=2754725 RepID=A0A7G7CNS2_9CORY|nr:enoyl-CoA hydratase [Corynebacterium incognita]QNE89238.1 enoyl-CoA hydratase [Corynebacterium incognita]